MAQNVTIAGASYEDVPSVDMPTTGGGTSSFYDIHDTTATAADVASGKVFYAADGVQTVGTASGGSSVARLYTGTTSTDVNTATKTVALDDSSGFSLENGVMVLVSFVKGNNVESFLLDVNGTGSHYARIKANYAAYTTPPSVSIGAYESVLFTFDGSSWIYTASGPMLSVLDRRFDYIHHWTGSTYSAAQASTKSVTCSGFKATKGRTVTVEFSYGNTYADGALQLNVGSTGAKNVYVNGEVTSATNTLTCDPHEYMTFVYDGKNYQFLYSSIKPPTYTLPTASTSTLGGVKVDGSTITITDGVISSTGGSVTMEDTEVDAAVEAAWPAPTGYAITPSQGYVERRQLLAIGLSDSVAQGEFVSVAGEGETVYVMGGYDWEPQVTIDSTGASVAYALYGPGTSGTLYTFTMPAEAVTVAMWYND